MCGRFHNPHLHAMTDLHPISFAQSRKKLVGIVIAAVPTLFGAIKILEKTPEQHDKMFTGAAFVLYPLAVIAIAGIAAATVFIFRKLRDTSPGFTIDDAGFTDNSSAVSAGFIPWSEVEGIDERTILGQHYIRVRTRNPEALIERQRGAFKRFMMRRNHRWFHAAISISAGALRCSIEELKDALDRRFKAYREGVQGPRNWTDRLDFSQSNTKEDK